MDFGDDVNIDDVHNEDDDHRAHAGSSLERLLQTLSRWLSPRSRYELFVAAFHQRI